MGIANYTTKVDEIKTLTEMPQLLGKHGAKSINMDFDAGRPSSLSFLVKLGSTAVPFRLPSNWKGVLQAMKDDKEVPNRFCTEDQARRVSWRITRDWVRAQMAIIEAGLATLPEAFLPYAVTNDGRTIYQSFSESGFALLQAAED